MAAPAVTSTVSLRSGEKRDFRQPIQCPGSKITHEKLRESLEIVQRQVNDFLTVQVDLEKGTSRHQNPSGTSDSVDDEDEDDEDDDGSPNSPKEERGQGDGEEVLPSQEPPEKKPKK